MTCDDGIVKICDVVNVSEPGMKPRGESIDWQTKEITGTITRSAQVDDKYNHP